MQIEASNAGLTGKDLARLRDRNAGKKWSTEEDSQLRAHLAQALFPDKVADLMGRSPSSVVARAQALGSLPTAWPSYEQLLEEVVRARATQSPTPATGEPRRTTSGDAKTNEVSASFNDS
jgi:hypothetical protein